jgi:hypothetical protein
VNRRTSIRMTPLAIPNRPIQSGTPSPKNGGLESLAACP